MEEINFIDIDDIPLSPSTFENMETMSFNDPRDEILERIEKTVNISVDYLRQLLVRVENLELQLKNNNKNN